MYISTDIDADLLVETIAGNNMYGFTVYVADTFLGKVKIHIWRGKTKKYI